MTTYPKDEWPGYVFRRRNYGATTVVWDYRVQWRGRPCAPTWPTKEGAYRYLRALVDGTKQPEYIKEGGP